MSESILEEGREIEQELERELRKDLPTLIKGKPQAETVLEQHPGGATGMPQLNAESFPSQLFWLTITFVALYLLMARSVLPRIHEVLEKRQHRLTHDLDRAESLSEEAEEARQAYEKLQAEARARAAQTMNETSAHLKTAQDQKFAEVDRELGEKITRGRKEIEKRLEALRSDLEPVIQELASETVARLTGVTPGEGDLREAVKKQGA